MAEKKLKFIDIFIVALIMFGPAIYISTIDFVNNLGIEANVFNLANNVFPFNDFAQNENWQATFLQLFQLVLAFFYLHVRGWSIKNIRYNVNLKSCFAVIFIFLLFSGLMDIFQSLFYGFQWIPNAIEESSFMDNFIGIDLSLVIFSLLNGFYEEVFFLVICGAAVEKQKYLVLAFALFIRFAIHTYQGIPIALGITIILGLGYYFLYSKKTKNLFPYAISHSLADIFGLSLVRFL